MLSLWSHNTGEKSHEPKKEVRGVLLEIRRRIAPGFPGGVLSEWPPRLFGQGNLYGKITVWENVDQTAIDQQGHKYSPLANIEKRVV